MFDFFVRLAVGCGIYKSTIGFLTGVACGLAAAVLLYLHYQVLRAEKWTKYLGWAYAVFCFQYSFPALASLLHRWGVAQSLNDYAQVLAQSLGSPVNNLCFLAAAMELLGVGATRAWEGRTERPRWLVPKWVVAVAAVAAILELIRPEAPLYRLPDALLSATCLGLVGYGMWQNSSPGKHPVIAYLNVTGAALYALLNLVYAANPVIVGGWPWEGFEPRLKTTISAMSSAILPADAAAKLRPLDCLDAAVFSIAFLLKISLFLGALLLIIRRLLVWSPASAQGLLDRITRKRGIYISAKGVLRALGESVEADLCALCLRLADGKADNVAWWRWLRESNPKRRRRVDIQALPPSDKSIVAWAMRMGFSEVFCPDRTSDPWLNSRYLEFVPGMRSFVTVPVRYHGAVIACVNVEWKDRRGYSATTIRRIQHVAELLAPTLHARRELIALDALATAFHSSRASVQKGEVGQAIPGLITAVHNALSPLATGFLLALGFRWTWCGCNDQGSSTRSSDQDAEQDAFKFVNSLAAVRQGQRLAARREPVKASNVEIGRLSLLIAPGCDPDTRPALAVDYLHRRTVAALLADAVLDSIHEDLSAILGKLQVELNRSAALGVEQWFELVANAARRGGLLWTVAAVPGEHGTRHFGSANDVATVNSVAAGAAAAATNDDVITPIPVASTAGSTHTVLRVPLRTKASRLWFGLGRKEFRHELAFDSPWKVFLHGVAQAADSALTRIEKQLLELAAQRVDSVATRVETAGLLMHTLGNDAAALILGTERLSELVPIGEGMVSAEVHRRVEDLKKSAHYFRQLTLAFKDQIPADDRSAVPLMEAVEHIQTLYGETLQSKNIELIVAVDPELMVGVPMNVAYIALVTLVSNSIEAVRDEGSIALAASSESDCVRCVVRDTGPGIHDGLAHRLFEPGFSTKGKGTGLGLALARNALRRCGGDLQLTAWQPGSTTFTIVFPR